MSSSEPDPDGPGDTPARQDGEPADDLDVDAAFAAIVAGWATDAGPGTGSWPAAENVEDGPRRGAHRADGPPSMASEAAGAPAGLDSPAGAGRPSAARPGARDPAPSDPVAEGVDGVPASEPLLPRLGGPPTPAEWPADRYIPPEPPPLPRGDLLTRISWAAVLGGPIFLLLAAIAWRTAPQLLVLAAVVAFVAGFVSLVARLPGDRGDDDDDGAVV